MNRSVNFIYNFTYYFCFINGDYFSEFCCCCFFADATHSTEYNMNWCWMLYMLYIIIISNLHINYHICSLELQHMGNCWLIFTSASFICTINVKIKAARQHINMAGFVKRANLHVNGKINSDKKISVENSIQIPLCLSTCNKKIQCMHLQATVKAYWKNL